MKKRYALIGASGRCAYMYAKPLVDDFKDVAEVVGIMDVNPVRMEAVKKHAGLDCPCYTDFDTMVAETKPDCGIVTTVDRFHHEYIIKCLEAGMDAITEKPMTVDADKCNAILEAEKRTGKRVIVTFNYRFAPYVTAIKQAIRDGAIGDVLSVDFEYLLDTSHGADYFRRWHRKKENSGGLLVHKSTHHFDLINWWIEQEPQDVMAFGALRYYGPNGEAGADRCLNCTKECAYRFNWGDSVFLKDFYRDAEHVDGYFRDRCIFADEINIEDTMSVNVKYLQGAQLSYSLIAHCPYEGWRASINGTGGRLEAQEYHSGMQSSEPAYVFTIYDRSGNKVEHTVPKSSGGHGGGDERLQRMIFRGDVPDPLGHQAGTYAGAISVMIGISANKAIAEGHKVRVTDLVPLQNYRP